MGEWMFKFLKEKLKKAGDAFKRKIEAEPSTEEIKEQIQLKEAQENEKREGILGRLKEKVTTRKITGERFDDLFDDFELTLLENNVAFEVVEKIKQDLKQVLIDKPIKREEFGNIFQVSLKKSISGLFEDEQKSIEEIIRTKTEKPFVILFLGVNGTGKTTTIAKLAHHLQKEGMSCVLVAADTWRKAAIEQLEEHGTNLNVKVIKHKYGADPAAVAFDGIAYAKAKGIDVVLIDTAGRQHSNVNLMREMEKLVRIAKPDCKIFVGESITGNDCVNQSKEFDKIAGIDAVILSKADVDEKGGAAISISYITKKPILYLGTGQGYEDLERFRKEKILNSLGL